MKVTAQPAPGWWLEKREDSPWYPSMRLFRQARPGEWGPVLERAAADLAALAAGNRTKLTPPRG